MFSKSKRACGVSFAISVLIGAAGCLHDQLRTARIISESPGREIVVAMPENTDGYRKLAERLAKAKLGNDCKFVEGKEIMTDDVDSTKDKGHGFVGPKETGHAIHRREYQATFRVTRSGGD